jgi:hypothetical protein
MKERMNEERMKGKVNQVKNERTNQRKERTWKEDEKERDDRENKIR